MSTFIDLLRNRLWEEAWGSMVEYDQDLVYVMRRDLEDYIISSTIVQEDAKEVKEEENDEPTTAQSTIPDVRQPLKTKKQKENQENGLLQKNVVDAPKEIKKEIPDAQEIETDNQMENNQQQKKVVDAPKEVEKELPDAQGSQTNRQRANLDAVEVPVVMSKPKEESRNSNRPTRGVSIRPTRGQSIRPTRGHSIRLARALSCLPTHAEKDTEETRVLIGVFKDGLSICKLNDIEHPYVFTEITDMKNISTELAGMIILTENADFDVSSIPKSIFTLLGLSKGNKLSFKNAKRGKCNKLVKAAISVWAKKIRLNV